MTWYSYEVGLLLLWLGSASLILGWSLRTARGPVGIRVLTVFALVTVVLMVGFNINTVLGSPKFTTMGKLPTQFRLLGFTEKDKIRYLWIDTDSGVPQSLALTHMTKQQEEHFAEAVRALKKGGSVRLHRDEGTNSPDVEDSPFHVDKRWTLPSKDGTDD